MAILNHGSSIRTTDGGQTTSTIVTAANIGSYAVASNATYYIGTTQNVFNRASGAQTLTGVSIDGNAATVTNGLTTTNYSSYALPISGGTMTGVLQSNKPINASGATYGSQATYVGNWSGTGWWGLGSESGHILKFDQVAYADVNSPTWIGATDLVLKLGTKFVRDSYYRTISGIGDYYASGASGWYTVASITLTTNCTGGVLYGTLYDHRYDGADAYQISIVARAECDFQTNNESHYVNVGCTILGSTNITNYQSKIRVLLVASSANSRTYEVQFLETAWNRDTWQLETSGSPVWTIYSTAQAPGTSTGTARVFYISNQNADNIRANTASYSPVYYDSANTAYYIDPASTSIVNSFKVYDALYFGDYTTYLSQATPYLRITTANGYGNFGPANSSWFHMTTDRPNFYMAVGLHINGDLFIYNTQSQLTSTSVRAPIFYDSGDTTYYLDPANTGTSLLVAGKVGIGITSPLLKLQVDAAPGNPATTGTTQNGIFRISNSTDNAVLDFGMRAAGAGAWLQSTDETSLAANYPLLLNPNGANVGINNLSADTNLQVVGHIHVGNQTTFENTGGWNKTIYLDGTYHARLRILGSAYASGKNSQTETYLWVDNTVSPYSGLVTNAGSFTINAGFTTLTNSARSPIFYDSDDTNYYCDPNSVSRLSSLRVYSAFDTASSDVYANMRVMRNNATTDGMYIGYGNSGSTSALTRIFGGGATTGELSKYSTYTLEPGSFRSPIFYDSNDTNFYLDPASASNINTLVVTGSARVGGASSRSVSGLTVGFTDNTAFAANTDVGDSDRMLSIVNESSTTNAMSVLGFRVNPNGGNANAMLDVKFVQTGATNTSALHYTFNHGGTFADRFSILSSGNVGIGATAPAALLQLSTGTPTASTSGIQFGDDTSARIFRSSSAVIRVTGAFEAGNGYIYASNYLQTGNNLIYPNGFSATQRLAIGNSANNAWIDGLTIAPGGIVTAYGDFRAPIFYDTDNTSYYINAAGTSVLNVISIASNSTFSTDSHLTFGPNSSWGSSIRFGGNGYTATGTEMASVVTTDGNLHLDAAKSNNGIYMNWYGGTGGVYFGNGSSGQVANISNTGNASFSGTIDATQFRDASNTAYYIDPASTSVLNALTVGGNNVLTTASTLTAGNLSGTIPSGVLGNSTLYVGTTAIALNRASASQSLTGVNIDGNAGGSSTFVASLGSGLNYDVDRTTKRSGLSHYSGYSSGTNRPTTYDYTLQVTDGGKGWEISMDWIATTGPAIYARSLRDCCQNWSSWVRILDSANYTYAANMNQYVRTTDNVTFANVTGAIFYDAANTAYYIDPASTSNLVGLTVANTITGSISGNAATATTATNSTQLGGVAAANYVRNDVDGSNSTALFRLTTITKSLTITTSWLDTGIVGADLSTGCYMISVYVDNYAVNGGHYQETYTGMMSWFSTGTNSTDYDEIVLHKSGHASNGAYINLRTIRQLSGSTNLKLQIISSVSTSGASNYVFKFRRLI